MLCVYLPNPYLWYDEAGQFFISQGLNHYSAPFSPEGGLYDVIVNNRGYNMDPGGFSVILFIWQKVSTSYLWLRLLPVIFFIGFVLSLYGVCKQETNNKILSLVLSTLPFILPVLSNRITEIRAYSMEMMGTMLSILLIMRFRENLSYKRLVLLTATQVFFMTSRYGYCMVALGISLYLIYYLYLHEKFCDFIKKTTVYELPLLMATMIIYIGMMSYQNKFADQMIYADYLSSTPLKLLSPMSILYYLVMISAVFKMKRKYDISIFHVITIIVGTEYFVLSALGLYPWEMHRTISAYVLFVFLIVIDTFKYFNNILNLKVYKWYGALLAFFLFLWFIQYTIISSNITEQQITELIGFVNNRKYSKIKVEAPLTPIVRYQYEYALLKDSCKKHGYPEKFLLIKGRTHSLSAHKEMKTLSEETECDIIWSWTEVPRFVTPIEGYPHFYKINIFND